MATVYISPSGGAVTQDGLTPDTAYAFSSLSTAETQAQTGGTIIFLNGNYPFGGNKSFNTVNGITYESQEFQGATLGDTGTQRTLTIGSSSNAITLKNFKFINIYLDAQNFTANLTVQGCFFDRDTANTTNGLTIRASGATTGTAGVFLTLQNCVIKWDLTGSSDGSRLFQGPYSKLLGCTLDITNASSISGTMNTFDGLPSEMKNNIWVCDTDAAMSASNAFAANSSYSSFYQMGSVNDSGGTNNLYDTNPLFVDSANGDYRLRPTSPCIGAATAS